MLTFDSKSIHIFAVFDSRRYALMIRMKALADASSISRLLYLNLAKCMQYLPFVSAHRSAFGSFYLSTAIILSEQNIEIEKRDQTRSPKRDRELCGISRENSFVSDWMARVHPRLKLLNSIYLLLFSVRASHPLKYADVYQMLQKLMKLYFDLFCYSVAATK